VAARDDQGNLVAAEDVQTDSQPRRRSTVYVVELSQKLSAAEHDAFTSRLRYWPRSIAQTANCSEWDIRLVYSTIQLQCVITLISKCLLSQETGFRASEGPADDANAEPYGNEVVWSDSRWCTNL